jgi:hypothetical protein
MYRDDELGFMSCGTEITMTGNSGMHDEQGHPVMLTHVWAANHASYRLRGIAELHAPDHDGFISVCQHCRTAYPCLTMRVGMEDVE